MNQSCPFGGTCLVSCLLLCGAWFLASSVLMYYAWNKVICTVTSFKKVKYWQPALLLLTILVLCMPCSMKQKSCRSHKKCDHSAEAHQAHQADEAKAPAKAAKAK